jgi:O-antigen ligase
MSKPARRETNPSSADATVARAADVGVEVPSPSAGRPSCPVADGGSSCQLAQSVVRVHWLDRIQEVLFPALIVFGPATWGVVEAWSFQVVQAVVALMVALLLLRIILQRDLRQVSGWVFLPVALMLAWIALQILPLPKAWVEAISPLTAELWAATPSEHTTVTLSLYPLATQRMFALLLVGACVFLVAANVYRTPAQVQRLLLCVVATGAAVAGLGIAQKFLGGDRVYWFVPPTHGNSGPFMNHNHYAQYLNLSIAAALGLVLIPNPRSSAAWRHMTRVLLSGLIALGAVGVALSTSRGGFGALAVAAIAGVFVLGRSRRGTIAALGVLVIGAAIVTTAALQFGGGAVRRIKQFSLAAEADSERFTIWQGAWATFERFPITGTGLNTFEFVYPMSGERTPHRVTHADNDYLQLLAECGLMGAGIVGLFLLLLAGLAWKVSRATDRTDQLAWVARALMLAILAVVLQSATDFAQRLPGIAVLMATYCGILLSAANAVSAGNRDVSVTSGPRRRVAFCTALVVVLGIWAWALVNADRDRRAESVWYEVEVRRAELARQRWQGPNAQYAALIAAAAEAARIQPRDMLYQYRLAILRWRSISRVTDARGNVVTTEQTREFAGRIADDLLQATTLCPSAQGPWLMAARIKLLVLDDPAGLELARHASRLNTSTRATDPLFDGETGH